jgi:hypothetical protein
VIDTSGKESDIDMSGYYSNARKEMEG